MYPAIVANNSIIAFRFAHAFSAFLLPNSRDKYFICDKFPVHLSTSVLFANLLGIVVNKYRQY